MLALAIKRARASGRTMGPHLLRLDVAKAPVPDAKHRLFELGESELPGATGGLLRITALLPLVCQALRGSLEAKSRSRDIAAGQDWRRNDSEDPCLQGSLVTEWQGKRHLGRGSAAATLISRDERSAPLKRAIPHGGKQDCAAATDQRPTRIDLCTARTNSAERRPHDRCRGGVFSDGLAASIVKGCAIRRDVSVGGERGLSFSTEMSAQESAAQLLSSQIVHSPTARGARSKLERREQSIGRW